MTSPAFRPAFSAGSPATSDSNARVDVGQHADRCRFRTARCRACEAREVGANLQPLSWPSRMHDDLALRARAARQPPCPAVPTCDVGGADLVMIVAALKPGLLRRRPGFTTPTTAGRSEIGQAPSAPCISTTASTIDREQQVHHRAHDQDLEPLPLGLRQELVGLAPVRGSSGFSPAIFT